eukprot:gene6532-1164_t
MCSVAPVSNTTTGAASERFETDLADIASAIDTSWILCCSFLVMFMQLGFALLEFSQVNQNFRSILFKNMSDVCIGSFMWMFVGFGFWNGNADNSNWFVAFGVPFTVGEDLLALWFFNLSFAATATTIVSGAVAERTKSLAYCCFAAIMCAGIYPIVAHWIWGDKGIFAVGNPDNLIGAVDFAGAGAVHLVGAIAGLLGAWVVGPRAVGSKFNPIKLDPDADSLPVRTEMRQRFQLAQMSFQIAGLFIIWFGFYGFNCGSVGSLFPDNATTIALIAINTTVTCVTSAVAAGAIALIFARGRAIPLDQPLNGALAGLVASTGPAGLVHPGWCLAIGLVAAALYALSERIIYWIKIDDPIKEQAIPAPSGNQELVFVVTMIDGVNALLELDNEYLEASFLPMFEELVSKLGKQYHGYQLMADDHNNTVETIFESAEDALSFCLNLQKQTMDLVLPKMLMLTNYCEIVYDTYGQVLFRGLRLKIGADSGFPLMYQEDSRLKFSGQSYDMAHNLCQLAAGGQTLVTDRLFELAPPPVLSSAGGPQRRASLIPSALGPDRYSTATSVTESQPNSSAFGPSLGTMFYHAALDASARLVGHFTTVSGAKATPVYSVLPYQLKLRTFPSLKHGQFVAGDKAPDPVSEQADGNWRLSDATDDHISHHALSSKANWEYVSAFGICYKRQ